jgi:hypothetical protein
VISSLVHSIGQVLIVMFLSNLKRINLYLANPSSGIFKHPHPWATLIPIFGVVGVLQIFFIFRLLISFKIRQYWGACTLKQ